MAGTLHQTASVRSRTRPVPAGEARDLLERARGGTRMAWNTRGEAWCAAGQVLALTARGRYRFQDIRDRAARILRSLEHTTEGDAPAAAAPRFMGGAAFDPEHVAGGAWAGFDAARFWLPRQQVVWVEGQAWETVNEVDGAPPFPPGRDVPEARLVESTRNAWLHAAGRGMDTMRRRGLEKLVLARCVQGPPADAEAMLRRLSAEEPRTVRFLVDPLGEGALVGATPEGLVGLQDGDLETHALAGSAAHHGDNGDARRQEDLLRSPKDFMEHQLVRDHIERALEAAGATGITADARRVRPLRTVQHLETPIHARFGGHVLDVVDALHPTPAVAGAPPEAAVQELRDLEPFDRGWYAGPVGWFDAQGNGRFAVALRCALSTAEGTWRFAGAGLVAGSDLEKEWQETEDKLASLGRVLGP